MDEWDGMGWVNFIPVTGAQELVVVCELLPGSNTFPEDPGSVKLKTNRLTFF